MYAQQQHRFGGGYQEKVYSETKCSFVPTNDVCPVKCPTHKPHCEQQAYKSGYDPLYSTSDNQLACTPPDSPYQHHNKHNCVLRDRSHPVLYQKGCQLTDTTSKCSTDYSQVISCSNGNLLDQYPCPPALPIYSLYITSSWSSSSFQRHEHHLLPVPPTNAGRQKALPHLPPVETSHDAETENLSQSPSSLFSLPEKEPHYHFQVAQITPVNASGRAVEVPVSTVKIG